MELKDFIAIGKIVKTIGIKGNLKIIPLTDFPERFLKLKEVFLYDELKEKFADNGFLGGKKFQISDCKVYDKYINLKLEKFDSIENSRELLNMILMILEKDRVKLDEGNYYFYELIGSRVFNKDSECIGEVVSIVNYGSGDLFNIRHGEKEILVPFKKEFVRNVDILNKRIDVDLIEGFLE